LLILNFQTPEVREICAKRSVATEKLGRAAALELAQVLSDMEACDTAAEFCELHLHRLTDVNFNEKHIGLSTGHQVKIRSGHPSYPDPPPQTTDWNSVTRLRIVSIEARND
jgi:hypothetical protein